MRNREEEVIGLGPQAEHLWKEEGEHGVILKNTDFEFSRSQGPWFGLLLLPRLVLLISPSPCFFENRTRMAAHGTQGTRGCQYST